MPGWLQDPPWPPALEAGETILLQGKGSLWQFKKAMTLVFAVYIVAGQLSHFVFFWLLSATDAPATAVLFNPSKPFSNAFVFVLLWLPFFHWQFRRHEAWMLTSERVLQKGIGGFPRDQIGEIDARFFGVAVRRSAPERRAKPKRLVFPCLQDPKSVRDALERLK